MSIMTPDFVINSPESLARVLAKDLREWTAQVTMFNGGYLKKSMHPLQRSDIVTLAATTYGKKDELVKLESIIVEALEGMGAEVTTGENQRSNLARTRTSWIFYRIPKGGENDQEEKAD